MKDHPLEDATTPSWGVAATLLECDERSLAIHDALGYNREGLRCPGVEPYIGTNGAYR